MPVTLGELAHCPMADLPPEEQQQPEQGPPATVEWSLRRDDQQISRQPAVRVTAAASTGRPWSLLTMLRRMRLVQDGSRYPPPERSSMRLRSMARRVSTVLLTAGALTLAAPGVAQAAGTEIYDGDFPDPYVLPVTASGSTTYWAYSTGARGGTCR